MEQGKAMAEKLADFVNGANSLQKREFVEELVRHTHRTLQEEVFGLFLMACEEWAKLHAEGMFDARNRYTVETSAKIVQVLKS